MITFFTVDYTKIPSGWDKKLKRNGRKSVVTLGNQSGYHSQLKTHHRKDMLTEYDDEGEIVQTADKALYSIDWHDTEQELIDAVVLKNAIEYDKYNNNNDMNNSIQVVENKVSVEIIGDEQDARDYIAANGAEWGET